MREINIPQTREEVVKVTGDEHAPLHAGPFRRFSACRRCLVVVARAALLHLRASAKVQAQARLLLSPRNHDCVGAPEAASFARKIARKLHRVECEAVSGERICVRARKSPQGILSYCQGL